MEPAGKEGGGMNRTELEDRYGYVCDCRIWHDPIDRLCAFCRMRREEIDEERKRELEEEDQ